MESRINARQRLKEVQYEVRIEQGWKTTVLGRKIRTPKEVMIAEQICLYDGKSLSKSKTCVEIKHPHPSKSPRVRYLHVERKLPCSPGYSLQKVLTAKDHVTTASLHLIGYKPSSDQVGFGSGCDLGQSMS